MRRIGIALVLVLGMVMGACSDDDVKKDTGTKVKLDKGPGTEGGAEDGPATGNEGGVLLDGSGGTEGGTTGDGPGPCVASVIGKKCTAKGEECGKANTCLLLTATDGICTCNCKPDDSKTPLVNEDSCPGQPKIQCSAKALEVTSGSTKSKKNFCLKLCTPQLGKNECSKPFVCHPGSGAWWSMYGKAVCFYSDSTIDWGLAYGCAKNDDCTVSTGAKCSVAKKDCATGAKCLPWKTGSDPGLCLKPGVCDTASGLCKPNKGKAGVKVGDPCKGDVDCGDNMDCQIEYDEAKDLGKVTAGKTCKADADCCSGTCNTTSGTCDAGKPCTVQNRNGYCAITDCSFVTTLPHAKCPTGSTCNRIYNTGICQKSCTLAATKTGQQIDSTCRGNAKDKMGDYECRGWDALVSSANSKKFADTAVCDFGPVVRCSWFKPPAGSKATVSCDSLGTWSTTTNTNTTKMGCRDLTNTVLTDKFSTKGWCYDDTAAGCVGTKTVCSGKCVDLQTDAANCGVCATACKTGETCKAGKCTTGSTTCTSPKVDCSGKCVDLKSDLANCGKCGTACASPKGACCSSTCVDMQTDVNNCGTCGTKCTSTQKCTAGKCA